MWKIPEKYREKEVLYRRLILFTLFLGLIVVYFSQILGIIGAAIWVLMPFIIGAILAFCLNTLTRVLMRFSRKVFHLKTTRRTLPAFKLVTILIVALVVVLIMVFVIPSLVNSVQRLAVEMPVKLSALVDTVYKKTVNVPMIHDWMDENRQMLSNMPSLLGNIAMILVTGSASDSIAGMTHLISSTMSWIWIVFLSVVFSFICFFNTTKFVNEGKLVAKAFLPEGIYQWLAHFLKMVSRIFSQYLGGTVIECLILAALVSVFGLIFNIPNAVLVGVVCGTCALVPMFGATTGAVVCTLFIFLDSPGKAITFLIMFICIQQVEGNFIYPNVVGKSVGLPAMYVVLAITIGGSVAGVLGMILSIPITTVFYELLMENAKARVEKKEQEEREKRMLENMEAEEDFEDLFNM